MPIEIEAPDGSVVEFPDGTPDDVITGAMQQAFGAPEQAPAPQQAAPEQPQQAGQTPAPVSSPQAPQGGTDALTASTRGMGQGMTLGFGDELMAGVAAPFRAAGRAVTGEDEGQGIGERLSTAYDLELENLRNLNRQSAEQNPAAFVAGEVAGGAATAGKAGAAGLTLLNMSKPTVSRMAGAAAAEGAVYGGLYGAGTGEGTDDRLAGATEGAAAGALAGGALGAAGGLLARRAARNAVPTTQDLRALKDAAYTRAEQAGQGSIPRTLRESFADTVEQQSKRLGISLGQTPKTSGAVDGVIRNFRAGDDLNLEQIDLLRRNLLDAAMSGDPSEARMAGIVLNRMDGFIDQMPGGPLWKEARSAYKTFRKSSTVDKLIERAALKVDQQTSTGWDNALQTEFRNFARNDKLMRSFSKDERDIIKTVARDGIGIRFLRKVGKLSPTSGFLPLAGNLIAFSTGNPWLMSGALIGELSKNIVTLSRRGRAKAALRLMQNAGEKPEVKALNDQTRELITSGVAVGSEQLPALTGEVLARQ